MADISITIIPTNKHMEVTITMVETTMVVTTTTIMVLITTVASRTVIIMVETTMPATIMEAIAMEPATTVATAMVVTTTTIMVVITTEASQIITRIMLMMPTTSKDPKLKLQQLIQEATSGEVILNRTTMIATTNRKKEIPTNRRTIIGIKILVQTPTTRPEAPSQDSLIHD